jgi:signal transduction histidine kinase
MSRGQVPMSRRPMAVLPLRAWLVLSHLVVLLLPVAAVVGTRALAWDLREETRAQLEIQGVLLARIAADAAGPGPLVDVAGPLSETLAATKARTLAGIRVVDADGIVIASSGDGLGEDLSADAEVREALEAGRVGVAVKPRPGRSSLSVADGGRRASVRLFVAVPIVRDEALLGAVVLSRTPREELGALYQMAPRLWWGALGAVLATWGLALLARARASHVAEVAAVAEALAGTARRLDERLAYIGEFASNVSHEFRTPLSTLKGTVELLQDDPDMPPAQRARFLANAEAEVDRLQRLVAGLLALARAERAGERQEVDLDAILDEVCARWPDTVREGAAGTVRGDPAQLGALLENLVANAWRHGGVGVGVSAARRGGRVELTVRDAGPGIDPANLPRVFDRFFTTARGAGGTGLGLALARAVAEAHGGEVAIDSAPGRTVLTVRLPA